MRQNNLFVVTSPFQVICAQEARERFCIGESNHLLIIDHDAAGSSAYIQKGAELDCGWSRVTRIQERRKRGVVKSVQRAWLTVRIVGRHGPARGKVFLGEPTRRWHALIGKIFGREIVWLDDGAASINLLYRFSGTEWLKSPNDTTPRFFTIFGTPALETESNGAIVQNYLKLRHSRREKRQVDHEQLWFVGQKISEAGILQREDELALIQRLFRTYGDKKIIYVAHRHDSNDKLTELSKICEVRRLNQTVESALESAETIPGQVVSWMSTALFTIDKLFPMISVHAVQIPCNHANTRKHEDLERVYRHLAATGITVLFRDQEINQV